MTPLGAYIRQIRSLRNITLTAMASGLSVTPAYLSALETGKRERFPIHLAEKICRFLELNMAEQDYMLDLAKASDTRIAIPGSADPLLFVATHRLVNHFANAGPLEIQEVLQAIDRCPSYRNSSGKSGNSHVAKEGNMDSS